MKKLKKVTAGEPDNGVVETRSQGKGRREINALSEGIKIHPSTCPDNTALL